VSGAWCAFLIGLMASGTFTTARIGEITSGPENDIISMSIAISQINFGLSSRLAYHEVAQAISGVLLNGARAWATPTEADEARLRDPERVTEAIRAGATVQLADIKIPASRAGYLTNWCEDLGYSEFYNVAFRLFGFNAVSTNFLYVSVLSTSTLIFFLTFYNNNLAIGSVTLTISALFLTAASDVFSKFMPSFAANRFLSTLALVPLIHLVHAALRCGPVRGAEIAAMTAQIFVLTSAVTFRSSAEWAFIAIFLICFLLLYLRRDRVGQQHAAVAKKRIAFILRTPRFVRVATVAGLTLLVTVGVGIIRNAQFDKRYFWNDNFPHHLIWHNAYIGLAANPSWHLYKPYPDVPDGGGDDVAFIPFMHYRAALGLPTNTTTGEIPNWILARPYEDFVRGAYITFLVDHPIYSAQLFFYYKPLGILSVLATNGAALAQHNLPMNVLTIIVSIALGVALFSLAETRRQRVDLALIGGLVWLCSLLPLMWAYPISFAMADQTWSAVFLLLMIICLFGAALLRQTLPAVRRRTDKVPRRA